MKFSTREDIEVPIEAVFATLGDFAAFERLGMRRGIEAERLDKLTRPGPGMAWRIRFAWRGKMREIDAELARYEPPVALWMDGSSKGFETKLGLTLLALSKKRTRVGVEFEVRPRTLPARLVVQSMKLAKGSLSQRYAKRVRDFAHGIEERFRLGRL